METKRKNRILVFTGDGKGKTTAALGMAVRAAGRGMPVAFVQFVKGTDAPGEIAGLKKLEGVELVRTGKGFIPPPGTEKYREHEKHAQAGLDTAAHILAAGRHGVVVLDEVCVAVAKDLLEEDKVLEAVRGAAEGVIIVMTGRGATEKMIEMADTVTEMKCVKHGYKEGINAQEGVEF